MQGNTDASITTVLSFNPHVERDQFRCIVHGLSMVLHPQATMTYLEDLPSGRNAF